MKLTKILLEYPGAFTPAPEDEIKKNQDDAKRRNDPYLRIEEYIKNGSKGILDLSDIEGDGDVDTTNLTYLPDNLTVGGTLALNYCKGLTRLPKNLTIEGSLDMFAAKIVALPDDIKVYGEIGAGHSRLEYIPDNFTVNGDLELDWCTNLKPLPKGLVVKGSLDIFATNILALPDDIEVGDSIWAAHSKLKYIPDNFTVNRDLHLSHCLNLTHLPKGLKVKGTLTINKTNIKQIPEDLEVGQLKT